MPNYICEGAYWEQVDEMIHTYGMSNESAQLELLNYNYEVVPCDKTCGHLEEKEVGKEE